MLRLLFVATVAYARVAVNTEIMDNHLIDFELLNDELVDLNFTETIALSQQTTAYVRTTLCEPGTFALSNFSNCLPCAPGSATPLTGASACELCAPGYWAAAGQSACSPCAPNTYSSGRGAETCSACFANAHSDAAAADCTCDGGFFKTPDFLQPMVVGDPLHVRDAFIDVAHCTI